MKNKVSIIIPTFNRAHLISDTLDSIIMQTHSNWECLVIDDGSADKTEELMDAYKAKDSRFKYVNRPNNRIKGANSCRNYGFELSTGDYIQWFDSDDLFLPNKLEMQLKAFEKDTDFVGCQGAEFQEDGKPPISKWNFITEGNLLLNHIKGSINFGTNGPLFRRSYLQGKPLFNESLSIRQEWEFFNRLLLDNPKVVILNEVLYVYRSLQNSIRGNIDYKKLKSKMHSDRIILKLINKQKPFNSTEDYIYRRNLLYSHIKYIKNLKILRKYKGICYALNTLLLSLNFNSVKITFTKLVKNPKIINNTFND